MVRRRSPALSVRDVTVPNSSPALTGGGLADGLIARLWRCGRQYFPTCGSDYQSFVNQVVELARIVTGASGSAIAFRGERGTICSARSGEGAPPLGAPVDITSGICKQCLDSGTPLWCEDVATDCRVAPKISQAVGIRAVAVVPIYRGDDITGILGVFSSVPGTFTDLHLKWLQQLANWVGSAESMPSREPVCGSNADVHFDIRPDITLLIAWEPAYRVFFRNLADVVSLRSRAPLARSSRQMHGLNDTFVHTRVPWKRFVESVFLHVILVGMLLGLSKIWPGERVASRRPLREAPVTYYPASQSFPAYESNRPAAYPKRPHISAHQGIIDTARDPEPRGTPGTRSTLTMPSPAIPVFANRRFRKPALDTAVSPPPDIAEAQFRQPHLPDFSVVAPPPKLSGGSGLRTINPPKSAVVPPSPDIRVFVTRSTLINRGQVGGGSAGLADISIVPPAPSLNDRAAALTYRATGGAPATGVQVVAPPPPIQTGQSLDATARAISLGNGVSQVVPPPSSLAGAVNSLGGGRNDSLAASAGGSQLVPPPPSIKDDGESFGGRGGSSSLDHVTSEVVPPPPSVPALAGGNYGTGGRAGSLARASAEGVLSPASTDGNAKIGGAGVAKDISTSSVPEADIDRSHPIYQDVQLRVISLAWAPPRSSYFSNFEVFIAEKRLNKEESQFIKLVYVFLPYQRRLSEYGVDALKIRRLRVTRDSTCDESLMDMTWPEDENGPSGLHHSGDAITSPSTDHNDVLPCYLTTADDYRRAVSRSR